MPRDKGILGDGLVPIVLVELNLHMLHSGNPVTLSGAPHRKVRDDYGPEVWVDGQCWIRGDPATVIAVTRKTAAVARHGYVSL